MPWRADDDRPGGDFAGPWDCSRAREWIDPYLDDLEGIDDSEALDDAGPDGGLDPARRVALEDHAAGCPDCRAEIALARRLRQGLREGLPLLACPPEVSDAVVRIARAEALAQVARVAREEAPAAGLAERLLGWLQGGALRPALAAAALLLLLLTGPLLYRAVTGPEPGAPPAVADGGSETGPDALAPDDAEYSAAEIAEAEKQARMILAYVASVGRDAGRSVQEDVFEPGVVRPTRQALDGLRTAGVTGGISSGPERRNRP